MILAGLVTLVKARTIPSPLFLFTGFQFVLLLLLPPTMDRYFLVLFAMTCQSFGFSRFTPSRHTSVRTFTASPAPIFAASIRPGADYICQNPDANFVFADANIPGATAIGASATAIRLGATANETFATAKTPGASAAGRIANAEVMGAVADGRMADAPERIALADVVFACANISVASAKMIFAFTKTISALAKNVKTPISACFSQ